MRVSLEHVVLAVTNRQLNVTAETLGHIVLAACSTAAAGCRVSMSSIHLESSGAVTCYSDPRGQPLTQVAAEALKRSLPCCTTENPALGRVVRFGSDEAAFRALLQSALVPLNRGAAQRGLVRLHRTLGSCDLDGLLAREQTRMAAAPAMTPSSEVRVDFVEESPVPIALQLDKGVSRPDFTPVLGSPVVARASEEVDATPVCPAVFEEGELPSASPEHFRAEKSDIRALLRRFALAN